MRVLLPLQEHVFHMSLNGQSHAEETLRTQAHPPLLSSTRKRALDTWMTCKEEELRPLLQS